jgi:hypothetical protein
MCLQGGRAHLLTACGVATLCCSPAKVRVGVGLELGSAHRETKGCLSHHPTASRDTSGAVKRTLTGGHSTTSACLYPFAHSQPPGEPGEG